MEYTLLKPQTAVVPWLLRVEANSHDLIKIKKK